MSVSTRVGIHTKTLFSMSTHIGEHYYRGTLIPVTRQHVSVYTNIAEHVSVYTNTAETSTRVCVCVCVCVTQV